MTLSSHRKYKIYIAATMRYGLGSEDAIAPHRLKKKKSREKGLRYLIVTLITIGVLVAILRV